MHKQETKIDSLDDLDCLVNGDIVKLDIQNSVIWRSRKLESLAVYYGTDESNKLKFVVPIDVLTNKPIYVYTVLREDIALRDDRLVLDETKSARGWHVVNQTEYFDLEKMLKKAGLRE